MRTLPFIERWLKAASLLLLLAINAPQAFAAFEDTGTGARPAALGDAYQGIADDNQSLMYNPAGLAQVRHYELSTEYSKLYTGLTDGSNLSQYYMGYAQPLQNHGTVALGWKQFSLDNLYTERTVSLGYGEWITSRVAWGIAMKQLYHSIASPGMVVDNAGNTQNGTPTFFTKNGNSKSVYSGDLGVLIRMSEKHLLSLSIQDVNQPNVALSGEDNDIIPQTLRAGYSYKANRNLTLAASVTRRQDDVTYTGAAERWWTSNDNGDVGLRASLASGSREFQQGGFGASYRLQRFQLDYAFIFNLAGVTPGATTGTHRFSITYAFGKPPAPTAKDLTPHRKELTAEEEAKQHRATMDALLKNDLEGLEQPAVKARPVAAPAPVAVAPVAKPVVAQAPVAAPVAQAPAPVAVAPEPTPVAAPVKTVAPVDQETQQTAQLMTSTPVAEVAPAAVEQKPVAVIRTVPTEAETMPSTQPSDVSVPLRATPPPPAPVVPLTRVELLAQVQAMISTYADQHAHKASAEAQLATLAPIFDKLQGYLQGSGTELIDYMTREEELNGESKDYAALVWDGRSAKDRMAVIDRTLESHLTAMLTARTWNKHDRRDQKYKAWLDPSLVQAKRLEVQHASVHFRLIFWGNMAQKAHEFEMMPEDLVVEPVAKPVVVEEKATPAVHAKGKPTAPPASAILRTNEDGTFVYKVQEGDTLINLAERFYGAYKTWRDIYYLNQDRLGRGGDLTPGQTLVMPKKERK